MGDPYKGKVAGHAMLHGRISGSHGRGIPRVAQCECGARSEPLMTIAQRVAWHQQHKADKIDDFVARGSDDRWREVHL